MATKYPFLVRGPTANSGLRIAAVEADSLHNAVNKILALHPNRFVKTQHAKHMDLITAKENAKQASKTNGRQYVIEGREGEFSFKGLPGKPGSNWAVFDKGKEIKLSKEEDDKLNNPGAVTSTTPKSKAKGSDKTEATNQKVMAKQAKKAAGKAASKKESKKDRVAMSGLMYKGKQVYLSPRRVEIMEAWLRNQ